MRTLITFMKHELKKQKNHHHLKTVLTEASSVQLLSRARRFATPWTAACQVSLSFTNSWSLLKLTSFELVMLSHPEARGRVQSQK